MFADPQTITINAVPITLPRTGSALDSGTFTKDDAAYKESISHAYGKRTRRTIRLDAKKLAPDVMDGSLNVPYTMAVYCVVDVPTVGYTLTEQKQICDGFLAYLTASSGAKVAQFLGGES
jgi:hypothetical protein